MHFVGLVFVDKPTKEAVAKAMHPHENKHWDWYRCGGRWDGMLLGEDEQDRRRTHNGFNFDDKNDSATNNNCRVSDLPKPVLDNPPYFFVADGEFVPREFIDMTKKSPHWEGMGALVPTPDWDSRFKAAIEKHKDGYVVVVDAHD